MEVRPDGFTRQLDLSRGTIVSIFRAYTFYIDPVARNRQSQITC